MLWFRRKRHEPLSHDALFATLTEVLRNQRNIMADVTRLNAAVAANTAAVADVQAVVAALQSADDQVAVDAAATQIETNTAALEALKPVVTAPSS